LEGNQACQGDLNQMVGHLHRAAGDAAHSALRWLRVLLCILTLVDVIKCDLLFSASLNIEFITLFMLIWLKSFVFNAHGVLHDSGAK